MNKRFHIDEKLFELIISDKEVFYQEVVNNDQYSGYDILETEGGQSIQITSLASSHFTHEELYSKGVEIIGIERILHYAPSKLTEVIEAKGLSNIDPHLNNIVPLSYFDKSFRNFSILMGQNKKLLSRLNIINSPCCWACLIKQAIRMKYKER